MKDDNFHHFQILIEDIKIKYELIYLFINRNYMDF